jgi:hypothetical protein
VQQEVLAVDAAVIRSRLCELLGPEPDCIIAMRERDGDFKFPTVPGDRAVSLVTAVDSGTKRSLALKLTCQSDNTSTK